LRDVWRGVIDTVVALFFFIPSLRSIPPIARLYLILLRAIISFAILIPSLLLFFGLSALFGLNGTSLPTFQDQYATLFFDLSLQFYLVQLFPLYCQP